MCFCVCVLQKKQIMSKAFILARPPPSECLCVCFTSDGFWIGKQRACVRHGTLSPVDEQMDRHKKQQDQTGRSLCMSVCLSARRKTERRDVDRGRWNREKLVHPSTAPLAEEHRAQPKRNILWALLQRLFWVLFFIFMSLLSPISTRPDDPWGLELHSNKWFTPSAVSEPGRLLLFS